MLLQQNNSTASSIILTAVAENEIFEDVNVITTLGEFAKKVEIAALDSLFASNHCVNHTEALRAIKQIINTTVIYVQEAVYVNARGISVVVNATSVDDTACLRAFHLVQRALDQLEGECGTIKFGSRITYSFDDIPWFNLH